MPMLVTQCILKHGVWWFAIQRFRHRHSVLSDMDVLQYPFAI